MFSMKKNILFIVIIISLSLILLGIILLKLQNYSTGRQGQVCFRNHCFLVEIAVTPEQRANGLMFRQDLDYNKGMLFIFEKEGKQGFWMKNVSIPLDIIWINKNREVVFISENSQPCMENYCPIIEPDREAKYVLEINGGLSEKLGLNVGDKVYIKYSE